MLSWERPIYLWNCLDSFYRSTKLPCKFILSDNASEDPGVSTVIKGFQRRNFFYAVHMEEKNDPMRIPKMIEAYWDQIEDFFVIVETDIEILPPPDKCWLELMSSYMREDPTIGAIGSRVYQPDFISKEEARTLEPDLTEEKLDFLIKTNAPMRSYQNTNEKLIAPHNPPLRLLMLRKKAYEEVGFDRDKIIHKKLLKNGWKSLISTEVAHRHLSLLNIYDYPQYSKSKREAFFSRDHYKKK